MQDTLLFLVFISISAMILSPSVMQSYSNHSSRQYLKDIKVQDTLQSFLSTSIHNYSYRSNAGIIDTFGQTLGINTSSSDGLYATITNHFTGRQQYHKTIAQIIAEHLATQYRISWNNSIIHLNPFFGDAKDQLSARLTHELSSLLPLHTRYNCTMEWQPIQHVPFGGKMSFGDPIPRVVSTYTSHQTISMPFLPCITLENKTYCFSPFHLKKTFETFFLDVEQLHNISILYNPSFNRSNELQFNYTNENISSLIGDILIQGVKTNNGSLLFPSVIDVLLSYVFSMNSFDLNNQDQNSSVNTMFQSMESFFDLCSDHNSSYTSGDLSAFIIDSFGDILLDNIKSIVLSSTQDFINFIKDILLSSIYPFIEIVSVELSSLFSFSIDSVTSIFNECIDLLFSFLSLSTASVTLTIWS